MPEKWIMIFCEIITGVIIKSKRKTFHISAKLLYNRVGE
jgi:hypothetical protein